MSFNPNGEFEVSESQEQEWLEGEGQEGSESSEELVIKVKSETQPDESADLKKERARKTLVAQLAAAQAGISNYQVKEASMMQDGGMYIVGERKPYAESPNVIPFSVAISAQDVSLIRKKIFPDESTTRVI